MQLPPGVDSQEPFSAAFHQTLLFVPSVAEVGLTLILVAAVLVPLERAFPVHHKGPPPAKSWVLNLLYWFFTPLCTRFATVFLICGSVIMAFGVGDKTLDMRLLHGFGPLAEQPLWLQAIEILVAADFIEYWTHRLFHRTRLWKFHAIHHSAEQLNWMSSARMHPLNDFVTRFCQVMPLLALGFSAQGIFAVIPYLFLYVVFLHSNVRWDFGPCRYLLVSPLYHHWHHSCDEEAIDKNFAGIFPVWDIFFGTCYFPRTAPKRYGVLTEPPPETLWGQLLYPLRIWK